MVSKIERFFVVNVTQNRLSNSLQNCEGGEN